MTSVYLASPWDCRDATRRVRALLIEAGHTVTSRWLDVPPGPSVPDEERGRAEATDDLRDIEAAEVFLVLTDPRPIGAGHVFHYLVERHESVLDAVRALP